MRDAVLLPLLGAFCVLQLFTYQNDIRKLMGPSYDYAMIALSPDPPTKDCSCEGQQKGESEELSPSQSLRQEQRQLLPSESHQQQPVQQIVQEPTLPTFTELLIRSNSDKYARHHFENFYEEWLEPYRHKEQLRMLEIGARDGKSLNVWDTYFTKAESIIGLSYGVGSDVVMNHTAALSNVKIVKGDQSEKETMDRLKAMGPFDIIIDDGSHVPTHVIFSLFSLWNAVKPGGVYIIEDIETSYWKDGAEIYGYHLPFSGIGSSPQFNVVSKLEQIQHVLVRHQIGAQDLTVMSGDWDLCSVEWGMNIVRLKKCGTRIVKPPMQRPTFDEHRMKAWIDGAKRTNPIVS